LLVLPVVILSISEGCYPSWHSGYETTPIRHRFDTIEIFKDSLVISGSINRVRAFTNYGFKPVSAHDDTGEQLHFRSFEIVWAKGLYFAIELERPTAGAKKVDIEVIFKTKSGGEKLERSFDFSEARIVDRAYDSSDWIQYRGQPPKK